MALNAFKKAERHKREVEDKGVVAKCAQPLLDEEDDDVIEESLAMCIVREGMKKQMAGTDTAGGMIKRCVYMRFRVCLACEYMFIPLVSIPYREYASV